MWLDDSKVPYHFGGKTHKPQNISPRQGITGIMKKINSEFNLDLDSYLIVRYSNENQALPLHQDNESILDNSHPIDIAPIGCSRKIEFWDSHSESLGSKVVNPNEEDLY